MMSLQEVLKTITKANGYTKTVNTVDIDIKDMQGVQEHESPAIFILDVNQSKKKGVSKLREITWNIALYGVVRGETLVSFEEIIADIEDAIEDNFTLAGSASKAEVENIATDNQLFADTGTFIFEMELVINYTRCHRSPR